MMLQEPLNLRVKVASIGPTPTIMVIKMAPALIMIKDSTNGVDKRELPGMILTKEDLGLSASSLTMTLRKHKKTMGSITTSIKMLLKRIGEVTSVKVMIVGAIGTSLPMNREGEVGMATIICVIPEVASQEKAHHTSASATSSLVL